MKPTNLQDSSPKTSRKRLVLGPAQRAVGVLAHRLVVVDVDQAAAEAVREEAGHEQREVAEAAQAGALLGAAALERASEPERQRLAMLRGIGRLSGRTYWHRRFTR